MKLSHYLKIYPFEDRPGHHLFFSTKKASVTLLKEDVLRAIDTGTLNQSDEEALLKLGIIVPDIEAEKLEVSAMLEKINNNNTCLNITVVLNLDCNFACIYCYEGDIKGKLYMSEQKADLLVDFIRSKFRAGMKSVNIDFYGGEPLLSSGLIKYISKNVKAFTEVKGASYTFTMINNGSLFKRKIAGELKELGLTGVKITLDGPPEIHNKYRPFKSGAGSFDTIIKNIRETCDIVGVGIGGNYDKESYMGLISLLDYLEEEGLTPDKIYSIKFGPVMKRPEGDSSPADYTDGCMSANEPWLIKADAFLREEVLKRGYNTQKIIPMPCQVELMDYYVVNFDGAVYKCPALIGKKDYEIGTLADGVEDYSVSHRLGFWKNRECTECEYLPLCFGGCRYMSYIREGNINRPDCKRLYFDVSLETMIKQDIKYRKPLKAKES